MKRRQAWLVGRHPFRNSMKTETRQSYFHLQRKQSPGAPTSSTAPSPMRMEIPSPSAFRSPATTRVFRSLFSPKYATPIAPQRTNRQAQKDANVNLLKWLHSRPGILQDWNF